MIPHPPGTNGGVHRGPDLGIRRNVMEGMLMRALIREGLLIVVDAKGKRRLHRAKIPMAMAENLVTRLQLVVLNGSDQNVIRLAELGADSPISRSAASGGSSRTSPAQRCARRAREQERAEDH